MNFLQFKNLVYAECFPSKESSRLDPRHEGWIKSGLIEIQQKIPCLKEEHREYISQDATYYSCGASAFPQPPGSYITGLRIQNADNDCDYVDAVPYTEAMFRNVLQRIQQCSCSAPTGTYGDEYYGYAYDYGSVDPELRPATSAIDLATTPTDHAFALFEGNVWLWPVLNSDRIAVLRWAGVKKNWKNTDVMPWKDERNEDDREVVELINAYLLTRYYQFDKCDSEKAGAANQLYMRKRAEMIIECKRRQAIKGPARYSASC